MKLKILTIMFVPMTVAAALVPDSCAQGACNFCDIITLINNIIQFIIYDVSAPVSAILFAYAGWLYISDAGRGTNLSKAKTIFEDVVIGLLIVFSSYLIVATIMSALVNTTVTNVLTTNFTCPDRPSSSNGYDNYDDTKEFFDEDEEILNDDDYWFDDTSGDISSSGNPEDIITTKEPPIIGDSGLYYKDQNDVEKKLSSKIDVSSTGECSDRTKRTCTSLEGLKVNTVAGVNSLAEGCGSGCSVRITGGTEYGHAGWNKKSSTCPAGSHCAGDKVDVSTDNAQFNTFMRNTVLKGVTPTYIKGVGPKYSNAKYNGKTYDVIYEGNHWDIRVK